MTNRMNRIERKLMKISTAAVICLTLLALIGMPAMAIAPYAKNFSNATSVTVSYAEHGIASSNEIHVNVQDLLGHAITDASVSGNPSTYLITVTFPAARTGTVKVTGPVGADTADAFSAIKGTDTVTICNGASLTTPQIATSGGKKQVCATEVTFHRGYTDTAGTLRVYRDATTHKIVFGLSFASGGGDLGGVPYSEIQHNVTSIPWGAIPLWQIAVPAGTTFTGASLIDLRPW